MNKKYKVAFTIIINLIVILLAITYIILFTNKTEEPKVEKETEKIEIKRISTYNNPIVPKGFKKVETETASWEEVEGIPICITLILSIVLYQKSDKYL